MILKVTILFAKVSALRWVEVLNWLATPITSEINLSTGWLLTRIASLKIISA
jgi:hypothetical protein